MMMKPGSLRRFRQLYEAALNLGMSESDANHYANDALKRELEHGDWQVVPQSAEGRMGL